jgi:glycosyltransferase involved in cell wall biosynthesis
MNAPSVSVAICTYNRPQYLREAVASVLAQTLTDFELILCDDASTDETPDICRELAAKDRRIRILRHEANIGMVANWNSGLQASRGRYYAKLDDDNHYLPAFLEKTVGLLERTPEAGFAFTDEWFIDGAGERLGRVTEERASEYGRATLAPGLHKDTPLLAARQSCGINTTTFIRSVLLEAGGFRAFGGTIADLDVFLNLASQGTLACFVPERLGEYRIHEGMGTSDLLINTQKARHAVAMWEAFRFEGTAERLRRDRLANAYTGLTRVLLLNKDVPGARGAIAAGRKAAPTRLRTLLTWLLLRLPAPLIESVLQRRYGRELEMLIVPQPAGEAAGKASPS